MKSAVQFVIIFSISIHFAYTSSDTNFAYSDAVKDEAETGAVPPVPNDEEYLRVAIDPSGLEAEVETLQARSCYPGECNAHCRKMGYPRGVCIGTYCQCRMRASPIADFKEENAVEDVVETAPKFLVPRLPSDVEPLDDKEDLESRAARRCTVPVCREICRRLGFRWFRCAGTRCICRR